MDYYAALGVVKSAEEADIRKAYRKLARQYHPDVNPDNSVAEEKFKQINAAQEVLLDTEKRKLYDRFGDDWEQYHKAGIDPAMHRRSRSPFDEIFGRDPWRQARPRRGRNIEHAVSVSLEEAFHGTTRSLQYEDGRSIEAKIQRGVYTGSKVMLKGKGAQGAAGAGDLYLHVTVLPHARFKRDGDNLKVTIPVDLYTAMLGGKVDVPTLERTVKLTISAETPNGKTIRLTGLGMPKLRNPDQRGNLYATVAVELPQDLSEQEKDLFNQLRG